MLFVVEGIKEEQSANGYKVISDIDFIASNGIKYFNVAIADYKARERIANRMIGAGKKPFDIIALNNITQEPNETAEGVILCPFTLINPNCKIGRFFHANIYSYVGHDCTIGDFVTFAPAVCCNGFVVIEDHVYIGTGAKIKQGTSANPLVIGKGAVVGMGAVVTKSVKPFTTVIGCPAKEMGG